MGSALPLHPHLHGLVTAGGIGPDGRWQESPTNFLVWGPVLRDVFRGKLIGLLRDLYREGKLRRPPDLDDDALRVLLHEAGQLEWHVRIEPQYSHGAGLVKYLARYLRVGPSRIIA